MTVKKTKKTRRKYDASFKEDVLKMIAAGRTVTDVSKALGIGTHIVYRWVKLEKVNSSENSSLGFDLGSEIERLKATLRRTEQERDILKKALGIFSRGA
jgi:transposase